MCAFYDDEQKIKKGDSAIYNSKYITIQSVKHIKENRTMDIIYTDENKEANLVNIPYQTSGYGFKLLSRN